MTPGTVTNAHVNLASRRLKIQRPSHVLARVFFLPCHDTGHQKKNAQASLDRV